ncbi:MAG: electron transfer flavoprotein subunit beta/FixA family protein [Chloroflexi bacterium]|nr:electron transfer flavoprotein subunit beta/FixA family protein [Chloroflexota bacterium]
MNIVVCMKQVPDTTARKELDGSFRLNRAELDAVVNPFDEYAIEEALRLKEEQGGEVTIVTMGPPSAEDTMRKALAMGADRGVLVTDPALAGTDWFGTCAVLAAAIKRLSLDLVITGMESTDARTGLVPGGLAELLGLPLLTYASKVQIEDGTACINRQIPGGYQEVEARLPVLISVVKGANEPRYPSLKGIMAARRKEIQKLALADLGLSPDVGAGAANERAHVTAATPRPEKTPGQVVKPETAAEAARVIADFLQSRKFI